MKPSHVTISGQLLPTDFNFITSELQLINQKLQSKSVKNSCHTTAIRLLFCTVLITVSLKIQLRQDTFSILGN